MLKFLSCGDTLLIRCKDEVNSGDRTIKDFILMKELTIS